MNVQVVSQRPLIRPAVWTVLAVWATGVTLGSLTGALRHLTPLGIVLIVAAGILLPAVVYLTNPRFRAMIEGVGLRTITAFHGWRIAAALLFFWYGAHDLLPALFVQRAAWGDLISGILAVAIAGLWPNRAAYWFFHIVGMADFVVAVLTGLTLTLAMRPGMQHILSFPVVLIPLFGVGLSGSSHIMAFDLLRRRRG